MNVPVELRVQQIIVNMERYRWLKRLKDERLVAVNIAGFEAAAGRAGKFDIAMPVIVGKTYHKTPVFNDTIKYVDFNPYWNVPPSISRDEILPKLKKDPGYLKKQNMDAMKPNNSLLVLGCGVIISLISFSCSPDKELNDQDTIPGYHTNGPSGSWDTTDIPFHYPHRDKRFRLSR